MAGAFITGAKAVGNFVGSHLGDIGSILGGFSFGSKGSGYNAQDYASQLALQNMYNKNYTKWLNENQYSQLRKGLENAGYNPLLALGASPQQGNLSGSGIPSTEGTTASFGNINKSRIDSIAVANAKKEGEKLDAETELLNAKTEETNANTATAKEGKGFTHAKNILKRFANFANDKTGVNLGDASKYFALSATKSGFAPIGSDVISDLIIKQLRKLYHKFKNTNYGHTANSAKGPLIFNDAQLDKLNSMPDVISRDYKYKKGRR